MKRLFDIIFALLLLIITFKFLLLIGLLVFFSSKGPILHWSKRIGINNVEFLMPKFRTMMIETPELATHLLEQPEKWITPIGAFLRRTSLDELPQLWSILIGKMSFVGPRPALFNQWDLIEERTQHGVQKLKPGLTGWAQVNGRDEISLEQKVLLDREYLELQSMLFDLKIILKTTKRITSSKNVSH